MTITGQQHSRDTGGGANHDETTGGPSGLEAWRVADAMSRGLIACDASTSLRTVASVMAKARIHCVVVEGIGAAGDRGWGIVSDLDLIAASTAAAAGWTAAHAAATEPLTVEMHETLDRAAQLMIEHDVAHLIVLDADGQRPVGVVSTLDVATALCRAPSRDRASAT